MEELITIATSRTPLDWARLLIQHLHLADTDYQHTANLVTWAGVNGATRYTSYASPAPSSTASTSTSVGSFAPLLVFAAGFNMDV